ncbi:MAG TPA: HAMP domain-containing sensor histidine kinase [Pelobium sp.]|nr:HAMP domain-containing sensor histidine kinase [Pelobium sp.]
MSPLAKIYRKAVLIFIGDEERFSLEHRIFNLFLFFVCLTTVFSFALNITFGLYESAVLTAGVCLFQSIILYLSRVEKRFKLALILTGTELNTLLAVNYFINGGITGPTGLLFLAVLFIMTSVVSQKNTWLWLFLNLFLMAGLFSIEYLYPDAILVGYENRLFIFTDVYTTYIMVVVLITSGIFYKRRAYEKQKQILETKAIALEKLNSEKTKLFSIISHDLRSPVGSVKQYLNFLKEHDLTDDEKAVIEDGLIKSTNEAYELLDNLLNWAKGQMGGSKPFITRLKVAETLATTLEQIREYAKSKDIIIKDTLSNIEVAGDKNMLQLVIRNLLYNAIKFSEVKGEIEFKVYEENNRAIFKVKDAGIGIGEVEKQKIFSLDVKTQIGTKKEKGTGLGLVLCKDYANLQNGEIWFESELGKGSTFFVSLPIYKD